jgi:putative hydrolase of the HAD superfamily
MGGGESPSGMRGVVLFDLGGTLVQYYGRSEIPEVLQQAITEVQDYLCQRGLLQGTAEEIWGRVAEENREASDYRVRPLEGRLARIFRLDENACADEFLGAMCRRFLEPAFSRARRYGDALPALQWLRSAGYRLAIVSNTAWGSPANLWREDIARHGLAELVDVAVFCRDVGWRKPAPEIFAYTLEKLRARPEDCVFVGDDPRWDFFGPMAVGIEAVLLDRGGTMQDITDAGVRNLHEFCDRLRSGEMD